MISIGEIAIIIIVALVVFGPDKLPELAQRLGRLFHQWQRFTSSIQKDIEESLKEEELNKRIEKAKEADQMYDKHNPL